MICWIFFSLDIGNLCLFSILIEDCQFFFLFSKNQLLVLLILLIFFLLSFLDYAISLLHSYIAVYFCFFWIFDRGVLIIDLRLVLISNQCLLMLKNSVFILANLYCSLSPYTAHSLPGPISSPFCC